MANRLEGIAEEMGRVLALSAFSPNIRERLDFSCALFDAEGQLLAQAAHIPVHLGALPCLISLLKDLPQKPGDGWIANSPYAGGTHLPDLTVVSPFFEPSTGSLAGFVAARAHHSDVGGMTPGSMPNSQEIFQEGLILPPTLLWKRGKPLKPLWDLILANVRTPGEREGDLRAQWAACRLGVERCQSYFSALAPQDRVEGLEALLWHGEQQLVSLLLPLGDRRVEAEEVLDWAQQELPLRLTLSLQRGHVQLDFRHSAQAVAAPINATRAITCAAAYFPFFCLMRAAHPKVFINQGALRRIRVQTRPGSLLEATPPFPVCAGNVETSQRICDLVWKALAELFPGQVPAQSASTMNNLTLGSSQGGRPYTYYETCGGGHGGGPLGVGASGQQVAMTNTRNTPAEILETYYPLRLWRYQLRQQSGGQGQHPGGCGVLRELEVLVDSQASLLATRRTLPAAGLAGGSPGQPGEDFLILPDSTRQRLDLPWSTQVPAGSRIHLQTPGGGGWGPTS